MNHVESRYHLSVSLARSPITTPSSSSTPHHYPPIYLINMAEGLRRVFAEKKEQVSTTLKNTLNTRYPRPTFTNTLAGPGVSSSTSILLSTHPTPHSSLLPPFYTNTPSAFVTFLTAGYPTADATVPLMLAMEAGGADIIELGVPFSDPMADGPVIQKANNVSGAISCRRLTTRRLPLRTALATSSASSTSRRPAPRASRRPSSSWVSRTDDQVTL